MEEKRDEARHSNFLTVQGTTSFRVIIFQPGKKSFKASKHICICEKCCVEYGSCNRFEEYFPKAVSLKAPPRRPKNDEPPVSNVSSDAVEFLPPLSVVAVAPEKKSNIPVWFMQIKSHKIADKEMEGEHGVLVEVGQSIIEAFHLEQHGRTPYI